MQDGKYLGGKGEKVKRLKGERLGGIVVTFSPFSLFPFSPFQK
jgi:hypothetical protein